MKLLVSFVSGLLFGLGLILSGMTDPRNIVDFLDVSGAWNPRLLFVMAGAVFVSFFAFRYAGRRSRSMLDEPMQIPTNRKLDMRLVVGATLFGIGWGLAGYCPGPALASVATGLMQPLIFVLAMLVGMACFEVLEQRRKP